MNNKSLDIIVPTYNEELFLPNLLSSLEHAIKEGKKVIPELQIRVIIADGGSNDKSEKIATRYPFEFLKCKTKGRGYQISEAYNMGSGEFVVVLHADHIIHKEALVELIQGVENHPECIWGILGHVYEEKNFKMSLVRMANFFRFNFKKVAFGDQGMFFYRELLDSLGGFPAQKLMEDVEVSMILHDYPSMRIGNLLISSSRRWKRQGFISYSLLTNSILKNYIIDRTGGENRLIAAENAWKNYEIDE